MKNFTKQELNKLVELTYEYGQSVPRLTRNEYDDWNNETGEFSQRTYDWLQLQFSKYNSIEDAKEKLQKLSKGINESKKVTKADIIELYKKGRSQAEIAEDLNISVDWVVKVTNHLGHWVGSKEDFDDEEKEDFDENKYYAQQHTDRVLKNESVILSFSQFVNESKNKEKSLQDYMLDSYDDFKDKVLKLYNACDWKNGKISKYEIFYFQGSDSSVGINHIELSIGLYNQNNEPVGLVDTDNRDIVLSHPDSWDYETPYRKCLTMNRKGEIDKQDGKTDCDKSEWNKRGTLFSF